MNRRLAKTRLVARLLAPALLVVVAAFCGLGAARAEAATASITRADGARAFVSVRALLAGIPQRGETLGRSGAKVTMLYFGDLECSFCRQFSLNALPAFIRTYVRTGKVKITYKSVQTATDSVSVFNEQQAAAYAAGEQNHFWQYAELFYKLQGPEDTSYVTTSFLNTIARTIGGGLKFNRWSVARDAAALRSQISSDSRLAARYGVIGTPTIAMIGPGGTNFVNSSSTGEFTQAALAGGVAAAS